MFAEIRRTLLRVLNIVGRRQRPDVASMAMAALAAMGLLCCGTACSCRHGWRLRGNYA
jgi:hypothetical protein